jgi:hypothetical protein
VIEQGAAQKKNVLVVVSIMSQFPELFRLVEKLKSSHEYNPIVYFNLGNQSGHVNFNQCLNSQVEVIDYFAGYIENRSEKLRNKTLASLFLLKRKENVHQISLLFRIKFFIKTKHPKLFHVLKEITYQLNKRFNFFSFFYRVAAKLKRARKELCILKKHDIKLMIFAEDNEDYFTPQLIRLGHKMGIKSIVFPYTFANQFEFLEDAFLNDRRVNKTVFNFVAGQLFPKWTYFYKGKKLLKSYPSFIFSSEIFRTAPPNPWIMSSGFADVIAVESSFMKEYYAKAGIPEEKLIEVGSASLDCLHEIHQDKGTYREKLATQYGLDLNKPWMVCALPPYQRNARWPFQSYEQFLEHFIQFFFQFDGIEVLFKFHPRFDVSDIQKMSEKYGIKHIQEDTLNLIAISDLYVASVSSTIRWALALGIPTINFDVYNYNYGDFDSSKNYFVVHRLEEFKIIFQSLYGKMMKSLGETRHPLQSHFASLDGKSSHRVLQLFSQLLKDQ